MGKIDFSIGQPEPVPEEKTILVNVKGRHASAVYRDLITSGSRGIYASFTFDAVWDDLTKIAVFEGSERKIDVELTGESCEVPPEVMEMPKSYLRIGVYGVDGTGSIVIPTVYASVRRIEQGTDPSGEHPAEKTKTLVEKLMDAAAAAERLAQSVRDDADAGEFDGADGTHIWWTTARVLPYGSGGGVATRKLNGLDGATPAVRDYVFAPEIEQSGEPTTLYVITQTTAVATAFDRICSIQGTAGEPGEDGFAPEVTITEITGGHRVTITSAAHPEGHSFDVLDGSGGGGPGATVFDCVIDGETMISTTGPDLEDVLAAAPNVIMRVSFDGETEQLYMLLAGNSGIFAAAGNGVILILSPVYIQGNDLTWVMEGIDIPFRTSQLLNDSGFLTQHQSLAAYRTAAVQDLIDQGLSQAIEGKYTKPPAGIPPEDLKETYLKEHQSLAAYRTAAAQDMIDAGKSDKVQEVTVATDGAVTQALDAGKVYHFTGALTALTLTLNSPAAGQQAQYHFDFVSGSAAPTVTIPATVTMPDGWTVEANTRYEVDILDGYGVAQSWEVTA